MYENQRYSRHTHNHRGMVHAVFGTGPGKTSRAVGLAVRMAGAGGEVIFVQFMKSGDSAEVEILRETRNIEYLCPGSVPFVLPKGPKTQHYDHVETALKWASEASQKGCDLLVCDEILDALHFELIHLGQIHTLIRQKDRKTELVLTGAEVPEALYDDLDYITQLTQIKHPYYRGVPARRGIEY